MQYSVGGHGKGHFISLWGWVGRRVKVTGQTAFILLGIVGPKSDSAPGGGVGVGDGGGGLMYSICSL